MKGKEVDDKIVDTSIGGQGDSAWRIIKKVACSCQNTGCGAMKPKVT